MRKEDRTWILRHSDLSNLSPECATKILDTLNSLIKYEIPLRDFEFEKQTATGVKDKLSDLVTEGSYLVVVNNTDISEIVGTAVLRPVTVHGKINVALLGFLYVNEKYRGKGYGKFIMATCESHAKKFNCTSVQLSVLGNNTSAKEFYDAVGYKPTQIFLAKNI